MMKKLFLVLIFFFFTIDFVSGQSVKSYCFVKRDTCDLYMDIYYPKQTPKACIIYTYGGGFMAGSRLHESGVEYCKTLQNEGYIVVSHDYRLGLKNQKYIGVANVKVIENAILLAVEDLYAVVKYLIDYQRELLIDTSKIILIGTSAGAITSLQADYMICRKMDLAKELPASFRFAGVVAFSGAIFSREGKADYLIPPAPTFFLHGIEDKLVKYNKIQLFNMGMFGSNALVKRFEKFGYPYQIYRYKKLGHEVATLLLHSLNETLCFIDAYVLNRANKHIDTTIFDPTISRSNLGQIKPSDMSKFLE